MSVNYFKYPQSVKIIKVIIEKLINVGFRIFKSFKLLIYNFRRIKTPILTAKPGGPIIPWGPCAPGAPDIPIGPGKPIPPKKKKTQIGNANHVESLFQIL